MEFEERKKDKDIIEEKDLIKQSEIFIKLISKLNINNTQELIKQDKKSLSMKIQYINKIISLYLKEKEKHKPSFSSSKTFFARILKRRRISFIFKLFEKANKNNNMKYKKNIIENKKIISFFFVVGSFNIFHKVISFKQQTKNKKSIISIYHLFNKIINLIGKLFLEEIIEIDHFELIIKLLLTFVIKNSLMSLEEDINKNNEIYNPIFFRSSVILIKKVFEKILLIEDKFNEKQNEFINNIIIFIHNNIIYSDFKEKHIRYTNKHFLSKYDCSAIKLLDLCNIILRTNSDIIVNNYLNLISDIYTFSFGYDNLMRPLLKQLEPLFINLTKKDLVKINEELIGSNFSLSLLNSLIKKENEIISEKACYIREGFYLKNAKSGIVANIKALENDFTIIFSFRLEKENEDEILLFCYITEKNWFKFILREKGPKNYEMVCEERNNQHELKININSNTNYIFCINVKIEYFKSVIKTRFIRDKDKDYHNGKDVKIKNIKKENIKIFIGCGINLKNNKLENKFRGFLGDIIIFNSKNYKGNTNNSFEGDFIMGLKGDYKNIYSLLLEKENQDNYFANKKRNILTKEKINNKDLEKNINSDNIKLIISPEYFKLLNYFDDIDYINTFNNIFDNKISEEYFIKRKYLDIKLKTESGEEDKVITIPASFFDKEFHTFKNEFTLNEFIKCDGIHLLSLIMEYYFQILNNIYEKKIVKESQEIKELCKKIEKNIFENLIFFNENILEKIKLFNVDLFDISKYFYQISITILKYIEIEEINFDIINYLIKIIETLNIEGNEDFVNDIKVKVIEFILNPNFFKKEEVNIEALNRTLKSLLNILNKNITNNNFKKKIINKEYFNQLFLLLWIFDEINIKKNKNINNKELIKETVDFYKELLNQSLKAIIIKKESDFQIVIEETDSKKNRIIKEKSKEEETGKDSEKEKKIEIIEFTFEKLYEYKDNNNIFCTLINIIKEINLTQNANLVKIIKIIKSIIQLKNKEERNTKNKILYSSIIYLVQIYLVDNDNANIKEKNFHAFIRKLGMNFDVILALISSINSLTLDKKENEIKLKTDNYNETLLSINLKELNENHFQIIDIIKSIFEDIVYILNTSSDRGEPNSSNNILEVLEKNLDLIFNSAKESQNIYLKDFFSSESKICAEFFYFKWKTFNDKKIFIENIIKKYNILLKMYPNPFFFKFYYILFKEVSEGNNIDNNNNKLILLQGMIQSMNHFITKNAKEDNINLVYNLFNLGVILDLEYNKKPFSLFENSTFQDLFFSYVSLLDITGALYLNYFIELDGLNGKIIGEIIFDIFFKISNKSFNKGKFVKTFMKIDEKKKESFTIFYFMDICKEKCLDKDKQTKEEVSKFVPNEKIKLIRNHLKNDKTKLFLGKNLYKIEHVNFSIYFLAKSFVYYKKGNLIKEACQFLKESFFSWISEDIYNLYTQKNRFYGNELCKTFPLYYFVKTFIEANIIPDKNFEKYENYIKNEMAMEIKDEFNLESCYSSRLSKNKKLMKKKTSLDESDIMDKKINSEIDKGINNKRISLASVNYLFHLSSKVVNTYNDLDWSFKSNNESKLSSEKDDDSSLNFIINGETLNLNSFSDIKDDNKIINNGKQFFLNKIFSEAFKSLLFKDKNFIKIKYTFLIKYRKYKNIREDTKQIDCPIVQKNYSNSLEPKIFMKKDSNFYDKKILKISHKYLKDCAYKNIESIDFYPHIFKFDEKNEKNKILDCELVTLTNISLGKMYFFDDYIIFKTELEDPRDTLKDMDTFIKYGISNKNKDFPSKKKFIVLYAKYITEIIKRRTLLVNNSVEIFMKNGKSYFFNFFRKNKLEKAYNYFNEMAQILEKKYGNKFIFCNNSNEDDIKKVVNYFKKGKITNYEYILKLNKYSTRTYNDTSQYPVFPWLLKKYDNMKELIQKLWSKENANQKELFALFRDMNYPYSQQSEKKRHEAMINFKKDVEDQEKLDEEDKFPTHWINHYSTSAFIYYFLMRLNPYLKSFIKLQEGRLEEPNRTFNNFKETEETLDFQNDNRELIPDFFCYFDFLLNLNCNLFGIYNNELLIDDFSFFLNIDISQYYNRISYFVVSLLNYNKVLNHHFVSRIINNWVDIIFGPRQLPNNNKELLECCNVYKKISYEQKTDIEKELQPFEEKITLNQKNEKEESQFMNKIEPIIVNIINFGICPRKILDENVIFDGKVKTYESIFKDYKFPEDKLIYFNYINDDNFILMKDIKKNKIKIREALLIENKNLKEKENVIYNFKSMNPMKEKNGIKKVQLYQYRYAYSTLYLQCNKLKLLIVLSCRYFENYFRVQCQDRIINVFYEDFITCIRSRNLFEGDSIFYTGMINGKLTEWGIVPFLDNNKNKKKVYKCNYNFIIKERKHLYAHKSSISVIETYSKQRIIITAGEDKFIYIRKMFDFELLTAIDLTYSFGNQIISKYINIFPSMIKVSDLNLLFVLIYDYDKKQTFIRGYNLNGIFFAQTDKNLFEENLQINNFSFTKNSNLIVGFYNSNKFYVLNAGILSPIWVKELEEKDEGKKGENENEIGNKIVEFNSNNGEFYILKEHEVIFTSINDKFKLKEFESL